MKIAFVSDMHGYHNSVIIPEVDCIISCGDSTLTGEIWEMKNFLIWLSAQKATNKIFINGNHEVQVERLNLMQSLVKEVDDSLIYLEDESVTVEGLKFWGSPKTPEFFSWAYMYNRADGDRQWMDIPVNTDILITHGPPYGVLDDVKPVRGYQDNHAGCSALLEKVREIKPVIHAFGHIHSWSGYKQLDKTLFINASICTESYKATNPPIVVILNENKEVVSVETL